MVRPEGLRKGFCGIDTIKCVIYLHIRHLAIAVVALPFATRGNLNVFAFLSTGNHRQGDRAIQT